MGSASALETEHLVVGSGAGGALTAAHLAEAGREVLVVEEGPRVEQGEVPPFSLEQMERQYRAGGLTAALGSPPVAYAEGCCVGGSTEVNSGLYHPPPAQTIAAWAERMQIRDFSHDALGAHAEEIERALGVQGMPRETPRASRLLQEGADALGWAAQEVPRWYRYDDGAQKQSMSRTYLPRAERAGARVQAGTRADRIRGRDGARIVDAQGTNGPLSISARHVWVCAGAIGSAALLQRSGVRGSVGRGLQMHPTAKLVARFDEPIDAHLDIPMHQVREFAPDLSFGGSASRPGFVALALSDDWDANRSAARDWRSSGVYYAAIRSTGRGRVVSVPGVRDPIVTYRLSGRDLALLRSGLERLAFLLFAAGARSIHPSVRGSGEITSPRDIATIGRHFRRNSASLMTVHLTSTVRMGERPDVCPADSFGNVRGLSGVTVNDASLLPEAPGVNPQGTIMAIASRNVERHLELAA